MHGIVAFVALSRLSVLKGYEYWPIGEILSACKTARDCPKQPHSVRRNSWLVVNTLCRGPSDIVAHWDSFYDLTLRFKSLPQSLMYSYGSALIKMLAPSNCSNDKLSHGGFWTWGTVCLFGVWVQCNIFFTTSRTCYCKGFRIKIKEDLIKCNYTRWSYHIEIWHKNGADLIRLRSSMAVKLYTLVLWHASYVINIMT